MALPTKRILALPAGTLPLSGTEAFEAVQAGVSVQLPSRAFVLPTDSLITVSGMGGSIPGSRQLTAGVGIAFVDGGPASTFQIVATGAVAGSANPTALVGPTAINGVALTYMRSDAAPAFNQAAAYTFSSVQTFTATNAATDGSVSLRAIIPSILFQETDAAANNRLWEISVNNEQFRFIVKSDIGGAASAWFLVDRTLNVIDSVGITATTVAITAGSFTQNGFVVPNVSSAPTWTAQHTWISTGGVGAASPIQITHASTPSIGLRTTGGAADSKQFDLRGDATAFYIRLVNDANSAATDVIVITRAAMVTSILALTATTIRLNTTSASTVGAAGGASALPATPLGYVAANVNGTAVKIPYYNN